MDGPIHSLLPQLLGRWLRLFQSVNILHPIRAQRRRLPINQLILLILVGELSTQVLTVNGQPSVGLADNTDPFGMFSLPIQVFAVHLQIIGHTVLITVAL